MFLTAVRVTSGKTSLVSKKLLKLSTTATA